MSLFELLGVPGVWIGLFVGGIVGAHYGLVGCVVGALVGALVGFIAGIGLSLLAITAAHVVCKLRGDTTSGDKGSRNQEGGGQ